MAESATDEVMTPPVVYFHLSVPVLDNAYIDLSAEPMYTVPSKPILGDAVILPVVVYAHRRTPLLLTL